MMPNGDRLRDLSEEWFEVHPADGGRVFYVHRPTSVSQWGYPEALLASLGRAVPAAPALPVLPPAAAALGAADHDAATPGRKAILERRIVERKETLALLREMGCRDDDTADLENDLDVLRRELSELAIRADLCPVPNLPPPVPPIPRPAPTPTPVVVPAAPPSNRPSATSEETIRRRIKDQEATLAMLRASGIGEDQLVHLQNDIDTLRVAILPPPARADAGGAAAGGARGGALAGGHVPLIQRGVSSHAASDLARMSSGVVRTKLSEIDRRMVATATEHFVDASFPPCSASLGPLDAGRNQHRQSRAAAISWARAQDIDGRRSRQGLAWHVFNGDPRPSDVSQGMLGDCWLISALAVLAERPQLLREIMISDRLNERGAYGVKLCKDGVWQAVIIDDYFPCSSRTLAFSEARRGALWVALIEKAYAKLHGSYAAIEAGHFREAMSTLTGAPCESERLQPHREDEPIDTELLWAKVVAAQSKGFLMGVSSLSDDGSPEADDAKRRGIVLGHAYSLLHVYTLRSGQRLLKLRNPWGRREVSCLLGIDRIPNPFLLLVRADADSMDVAHVG